MAGMEKQFYIPKESTPFVAPVIVEPIATGIKNESEGKPMNLSLIPKLFEVIVKIIEVIKQVETPGLTGGEKLEIALSKVKDILDPLDLTNETIIMQGISFIVELLTVLKVLPAHKEA